MVGSFGVGMAEARSAVLRMSCVSLEFQPAQRIGAIKIY